MNVKVKINGVCYGATGIVRHNKESFIAQNKGRLFELPEDEDEAKLSELYDYCQIAVSEAAGGKHEPPPQDEPVEPQNEPPTQGRRVSKPRKAAPADEEANETKE